MYIKKTVSFLCLTAVLCAIPGIIRAQCFATPGNPVGGAENIGVMMEKHLRVMSSYRYHKASHYYTGDELYAGDQRTLKRAYYNYASLLTAYGITDRVSVELDAGYFFNKTQTYRHSGEELTGRGFSNMTANVKYAVYQNFLERVEFTLAGGVKIPLSQTYQKVDGVQLPVDIQPSTASYGINLESFFVKENVEHSWRIFWINRFVKNFENPYDFLFGNTYSTAVFYSKHFRFDSERFEHWTAILQARYEFMEQNIRNDQKVSASGGHLLLLGPQVNCSIDQKWNLSLLFEKVVYRHYNDVQLGGNYSIGLQLSRDISLY